MDWRYLTDCKFFSTDSCQNPSCPYRHQKQQKKDQDNDEKDQNGNENQGLDYEITKLCYKWSNYQCYNVCCPFLHPGHGVPINQTSFQIPNHPSYHHTMATKSDENIQSNSSSSNNSNSNGTNSNSNRISTISVKSDQICKFFLAGKCKAKDQCRFLHHLPKVSHKRHHDNGNHNDSESVISRISSDGDSILEKYSFSKQMKRVITGSDHRIHIKRTKSNHENSF